MPAPAAERYPEIFYARRRLSVVVADGIDGTPAPMPTLQVATSCARSLYQRVMTLNARLRVPWCAITLSLAPRKMPILTLRGVTKDYMTDGQRVRAIDNLSLEVERGEFVALVGRSGCGKSTLLNLAGAMDFPTAGHVLLDGVSTSSLKDSALTQLRRNKIGFIFQSFQLLPTLTVFENIELPLLLAGKQNAHVSARESLIWVELEGFGDRYPHQLSGGQMQRVAIARALIHRPTVVLADEPTGNLDSLTGNVILELLGRLTREQNTATIVATHSTEAAALADVVVTLRDGNIQQISRKRY